MSFVAQIGKFAKNTKDKLQRVRRGVTIKLFGAVIMDTPVGEVGIGNPDDWRMTDEQKKSILKGGYVGGRLRANWVLSTGTPSTEVTEETDKSGDQTLTKMQAGVQASDGNVPVFLSNSLPYAARIEFDGWSHTKAPEGMVRRNVVRFNRLIQLEAKK